MADNRPVRLQSRRVKGFDLQTLSLATNGLPAVLCTRPGKWGNPWKIKAFPANRTQEECVRLFKQTAIQDMVAGARHADYFNIEGLRGKNLACFCKIGTPCHADFLLEIANSPTCEAAP